MTIWRRTGSLIKELEKKETLSGMKRSAVSTKSSEPMAGHWRNGLLETMQDPKCVIKENDRVTVIKDKYPKARHHYLVLPKEDIHSINELTREHEQLLHLMEKIGLEVADENKDHQFILGYHAIPSMRRLHLHVVSTDFDSPCLKNKFHWNSFTTPFFRKSQVVREELREHGRVKKMSATEGDVHLKKALQCHKCSYRPKNMPDLKRHLPSHLNAK